MKKRIHNITSKPYIIVGIICLALFFRFYNFGNWLTFGMDQEYQALIGRNIIKGLHFPLIGVNASDTGLYLGPFFSYFAAIILFLSSGSPLGGAVAATLTGVVVTWLVYRVGKALFDRSIGLFASLFYGGSFLVSFYDRQFWNPVLIPPFSLLTGYYLYQILSGKPKQMYKLALVFGLAIQSHLSILIFIPAITYVFIKSRKLINTKIWFLSISIFIILQLPVIFFDIRHNFTNTRAWVNILTGRNKSVEESDIIGRNTLFISSLGRFLWIPSGPDLFTESGQCKELLPFRKNPHPEAIILALTAIVIFIIKSRQKKSYSLSSKIVLGILITTIIFIQIYGRQIFEYYLLFFFPWFAIILGWTAVYIFRQLKYRKLILSVIMIFIILNLYTLLTATSSYSYEDKLKAVNFVKSHLQTKTYTLEALGECPRFGGYRYLFDYYLGRPPVSSYMDSYFGWLYGKDKRVSNDTSIVLLSMIDPRDSPENVARWEEEKIRYIMENNVIAEKKFGKIHVLILRSKIAV